MSKFIGFKETKDALTFLDVIEKHSDVLVKFGFFPKDPFDLRDTINKVISVLAAKK